MLDVLNRDCCELVLSYVPVKDILRAERVSRQWQSAMLQYLRGIRIRIQAELTYYNKTRGPACRILSLYYRDEETAFENITKKLGSSVVASYCHNKVILLIITRNCPNLEHIALYNMRPDDLSLTDQELNAVNSMPLKQMVFEDCTRINDACISKFVKSEILEELLIIRNKQMTGQCLTNLKSTNLKFLILNTCQKLKFNHLLSVVDKMTGLKELELSDVPMEILQNAHLLLNEMPSLEKITLHFRNKIELSGDIPGCISRLGYLKHLDLNMNPNVTDDWLEAVARGCSQLQVLKINGCSVSARAVEKVCRAVGPPLRNLHVVDIYTMNEHYAVACIRFCPDLERWAPLIDYPGYIMELHDFDGDDEDDEESDDDNFNWDPESSESEEFYYEAS